LPVEWSTGAGAPAVLGAAASVESRDFAGHARVGEGGLAVEGVSKSRGGDSMERKRRYLPSLGAMNNAGAVVAGR
jgi:hypothetical protein